jgi:AcrR family transcriptional regulator
MVQNTIQEKRMREYFIEATKEILRGEGLRAVSVRNISEKAGYSYATLYNYFTDVKELIFECVQDFSQDCEEFIDRRVKNKPKGIERIKEITKSYSQYFIQYPGIFELFFIEKTSEIAGKKPTLALINTFFAKQCEEDLNYAVQHGQIKAEDSDQMIETLFNATIGILLNYVFRRHPSNYKTYTKSLKEQIDFILERH